MQYKCEWCLTELEVQATQAAIVHQCQRCQCKTWHYTLAEFETLRATPSNQMDTAILGRGVLTQEFEVMETADGQVTQTHWQLDGQTLSAPPTDQAQH
jgi:hypothetical protein